MRMQFLNGGLANQVFQYIFYRFAELRHPEEGWVLDDSFFFVHQIHNGYELERVFGLRPSLLSRLFDADVWDYMIGLKREQNLSIPEILRQNGENIKMIAETDNWKEWNPFSGEIVSVPGDTYQPEITEIPGETVYYHGYWIHHCWFHAHAARLREELAFSVITDDKNKRLLEQIVQSDSCSVHIRRGDYVTLGFSPDDAVYKELITKMLEAVPGMTLFVFSDDQAYCRSHADALGLTLPQETVYVEGNIGENAFRDLQLMCNCKNMILSNSAFCFLAALLNENLQNVLNPTQRMLVFTP